MCTIAMIAAIANVSPALAGKSGAVMARADAAVGASEGEGSGAEILVTAQRRESRIQDTAVAVNAIGSDELRERGFRRLNDLAGLAAGVNIPNQSLGTQAVFIRGIGTSRPIGNPSVGVYLDDIYIPRSFGTGWQGSLPDIARVEVLHGPQGTLYGQNSSAGALKLVSITPGQKTVAWGELGYGNFNAFDARAYVAGPVSDNLSVSVAASHSRRDGVDYNATLGRDVGRLSGDQARGILHFTPGNTDIVLSADYLRDRSDYRTASPLNVAGAGVRRTFSDIDPRQNYDGGGVTLRISQPLSDALSLRSITGYRKFKMNLPTDTDGVATYLSGFDQTLRQNQISQEFQLVGDIGRLSLTAGALAYREHFDVYRLSWASNAFSVIDTRNETTSYGIYAQGDYKLTDALTLTLGLRYSNERDRMDALGYRSDVNGIRGATSFDVSGLDKTDTSFVPRVELSYRFAPEILGYATFAQGRTSGGWNTAPGNAAVARIPVGQERVTSYEGGLKAGTSDKRLQASIAIFYNDYSDYQASITNPVIDGQVVTGAVIQNAGDAHIYGGELEVTARPSHRLDVRFSAAYLKSAFDSYENPSGAASSNYVGQGLPYVPEFSGGLSVGYTLPVAHVGELKLLGTGRHETWSYSAVNTTREQTKFPEQTYIDTTLLFTPADSHWTLSIEARNLLDKTYVLPIAGAWAPAQGLQGVGYSTPRTIMARLRYDL